MSIENKKINRILYNLISNRIEEIENKVNLEDDLERAWIDKDIIYEDILQKLMVSYFPKIVKDSISDEDMDTCYDLLFSIPIKIIIKDIRFFDMYNNYYENIKNYNSNKYNKFINIYLTILKDYKKSLK